MCYQEIMSACAHAVELYKAAIKLKPVQYSCLWKSVFDGAVLLFEAVTVLSLLTYLLAFQKDSLFECFWH